MNRFAWLLFVLAACKGPDDTDDTDLPIDADGDGYDITSDCDDTDEAIHPGATEICDGIDQDCQGGADDGIATGTWYADVDQDTFGDPATADDGCQRPGTVGNGDDCDDTDASITVGGEYYEDVDRDGFGAGEITVFCDPPPGYAENADDCDDVNPDVNPGAAEVCDDSDQNCNGEADEGLVFETWFTDVDGDGFGNASSGVLACAGDTTVGGDCDDADDAVHPAADERCNTVDDDCDAEIDEDAIDAGSWYADADSDTFGDAGSVEVACDPPSGFVADGTDCDDADAVVFPGATELCNSIDDDCDGTIDDGLATTDWFADLDLDGFGDPASLTAACSQPSGLIADGTDCDDAVATTFPGADELCNAVDDDCDGAVDDAPIDETTWYADADHDGFGDASLPVVGCDAPPDFVASDSDCDDLDAYVFPGAAELCDAQANDCDTALAWLQSDEDGLALVYDLRGATDVTADLLTGSYALGAGGTLNICTGTWDVQIDAEGGNAVRGIGGNVVLSGGGTHPILVGAGDLAATDLTLQDGAGGGSAASCMSAIGSVGGSFLTFENCEGSLSADGTGYIGPLTITDNYGTTAVDVDGAFYSAGLTVTDSATDMFRFGGDTTIYDGLFVGNAGGGSLTGNLDLQRVRFEDNGDTIAYAGTDTHVGLGIVQFLGTTLTAGPVARFQLLGTADATFSSVAISDNTSPDPIFVVDGTAATGGTVSFLTSGATRNSGGSSSAPIVVGLGVTNALVGTLVLDGTTFQDGSAGTWSNFEGWADDLQVTQSGFVGGSQNYSASLVANTGTFVDFGVSDADANGLEVTIASPTVFAGPHVLRNGGTGLVFHGGEDLDIENPDIGGNGVGLEWDGGAVSCVGDPAGLFLQGFYANQTGLIVPNVTGATFTSDTCDFGLLLNENTVADVQTPAGISTYGDDATFTCDTTGCVP